MKSSPGKMYAIGVLAFVLFLSTLVGVPVLPALSRELGAGTTQIPIIVSSALATVVIFQLFTGTLADRFSRRNIILTGALLGSVSSLLCAVATNWVQLLTLRIVGGIADAVAMPALLAITATLGAEQPGKFFGILRSSQGLSFVIGPALGSLFSVFFLRLPFIADGVLSLLAFLATVWLIKDKEKVKSGHSFSVFRSLRLVFADNKVFLYLLMGISGMFAFGILYSFIPTISQTLGLEPWQIGMILTGGALVYSFTSYAVGALTDRHGRNLFAIVSQVIIVVAVTCLIFSNRFVTLLLSYMLFCIGEATTYLLCFIYAAEIFDKKYIGISIGVFDSVMDFSLFIGPLLAISVYGATNNFNIVMFMAMFPAVLAFFTTLMCLPRRVAQIDNKNVTKNKI